MQHWTQQWGRDHWQHLTGLEPGQEWAKLCNSVHITPGTRNSSHRHSPCTRTVLISSTLNPGLSIKPGFTLQALAFFWNSFSVFIIKKSSSLPGFPFTHIAYMVKLLSVTSAKITTQVWSFLRPSIQWILRIHVNYHGSHIVSLSIPVFNTKIGLT